MSQQVFCFQSHQVRTIETDNQVWFAARDVFKALEIKWSGTSSLYIIPDSWRRVLKLQTLRNGLQSLVVLSEAAVYKLAFRSNKPEADKFTNWVASEVLPAIRKTGQYTEHKNRVSTPAIPIVTFEQQLEPHFAGIKAHRSAMYDHEREIINILHRALCCTHHDTPQRSAMMQMNYAVGDLWHVINHAFNAVEAQAKSMCLMARM